MHGSCQVLHWQCELWEWTGGSLLKSDHAPGNENSSIAVSKSTGWSASIGPTLQPTPPFASLEASLTYSAQTQLTETIPNLSCNFANDDYACVEWQIELSHYNKYRGHRGKPFVSTDFTKVKVGGIPREAFAFLNRIYSLGTSGDSRWSAATCWMHFLGNNQGLGSLFCWFGSRGHDATSCTKARRYLWRYTILL